MSERGEALARQFEQRNDDLIATVERCPDARWSARCPDTGWSANVQAHHIAVDQAFLTLALGAIANGDAFEPVAMEVIDRVNAEHANDYAHVSKGEVLTALREHGATAAAWIRSLSDEQLDWKGIFVVGSEAATVEQLIRFLSIGEIERHGGFLQQAIGG